MRLRGSLVLAGAVAALALTAAPAGALGPFHQRTVQVSVPGHVSSLVVRGQVGDITVVPGAATRIVASEQYNLSAPTVTDSLAGGVLGVAAPCPSNPVLDLGLNDCTVDFVVSVPRSVIVDVATDVGNVTTRGLRGAETLRTDAGEVFADEVAAPRLTAIVGSGTIRTDLVRSPRSVVARVSDGDVAISVPAGSYVLHVHTDVGSSRIRGITAASDAARTITATNDDGNVSITGH